VTALAGIPGGRAGRAHAHKTVFFGSGTFAVPILDAVATLPGVEVVGVVTAPDRPAGRGGRLGASPVAARATSYGLPVLRPERLRDAAVAADILGFGAEVGLLADYGRIVPEAILGGFPRGILNVHPSLLPRHRGASPVPAAILAGDAETGVTMIVMDAGVDSGPIVAGRSRRLDGTEATPELEALLAADGAELVRGALPRYLAGELPAVLQDTTAASLTRPLRRSDGRLDPGRPAGLLERQVRAFRPWPGTFLETDVGRLIVHFVVVAAGVPGDEVGALVADGDGLAVATPESRLRLTEVGRAGGRRMTAAELRRGWPAIVGARAAGGPV